MQTVSFSVSLFLAAVNILVAIQVTRYISSSKKDRSIDLLQWMQFHGWTYDAVHDLYQRTWCDSSGDHIEAMSLDDLVDSFVCRKPNPTLVEVLKRRF